MKLTKNLQKTKKNNKTNGFRKDGGGGGHLSKIHWFYLFFLFFEGFWLVSLVFIGFSMLFIGFSFKSKENLRKTNENQ